MDLVTIENPVATEGLMTVQDLVNGRQYVWSLVPWWAICITVLQCQIEILLQGKPLEGSLRSRFHIDHIQPARYYVFCIPQAVFEPKGIITIEGIHPYIAHVKHGVIHVAKHSSLVTHATDKQFARWESERAETIRTFC